MQFNIKKRKPQNKIFNCISKLINNVAFISITSILIVIVIFIDDFRILFMPESYDKYVDFILIFCFFYFIVELILSCLGDF